MSFFPSTAEGSRNEAEANLCLNSETSGVKCERKNKKTPKTPQQPTIKKERHRGGTWLIAKPIPLYKSQGGNANVEINRSSKNSCFFFFFNHLPELKKNSVM